VLGHGSKAIDVASGAPQLVVQDRFATEQPLRRIRSSARCRCSDIRGPIV